MELTDDQKFLAALSSLEHDQWAHWTRYMLEVLAGANCPYCAADIFPSATLYTIEHEEGCHVGRWCRQINTPYSELSPTEQVSDQEWAHKVFLLVMPYMMRKMGALQAGSLQVLEQIAKTQDIEALITEADPTSKPLKVAVLDLFAQFEDPTRNDQDGDIQPQLDRMAELIGYEGSMRSMASKAKGNVDKLKDLLDMIPPSLVTMPCGHSPTSVVALDDGSSVCAECEKVKSENGG
jgi:hypothetical protein